MAEHRHGADRLTEFNAIHLRHQDVGDDDVDDGVFLQAGQCLVTVTGYHHVIEPCEIVLKEIEHLQIVFHDEQGVDKLLFLFLIDIPILRFSGGKLITVEQIIL